MNDNSLRMLLQRIHRSGSASRSRSRLAAAKRRSSRLHLEQLEDRTLLSTFQWTGAGPDTLWTDTQNWALVPGTGTSLTNYPGAVGDIAQFTGTPAGNGTVSLNQAITVGEVDFGTASNISINSSNRSALTLDNTSFGPKALLTTMPSNTGVDLFNVTLNVPNTPLAATLSAGTLQLNNSNAATNLIGNSSVFTVNGGTLAVTAPGNTGSASITVNNGGTLAVSLGGTLANTPTVSVNAGGNFQVADNAGVSASGRFNSAANASIVLNGGSFSYIGANNAASTDNLPTVKLNGGSSTIATTTNGATGSVALTSTGLSRQTGATVTFIGSQAGTGIENLDTSSSRFAFNTPPTTFGNGGGILPYAVVINNNFGGFATYDTANGSIAAFANYVSSIALAGPGDTVLETGPETLSSNKTINGLVLTGAGAVSEAGNTLTLATGGLLNTATSGGTIAGGTLLFNPTGSGGSGTGEGIVFSGSVGGATANFYNLGFRPAANIPANVNANNVGVFPATGPTQITYNLTPTSTRIDPSLNYPLATGLTGSGGNGPTPALPAGTQNADLAAQWTGSLNVVTAGSYTFSMTVFDGAYLYIDGNPVFAAGNNGNGPAAVSLPITLSAGLHTFRETFDHAVGSAANVVAYAGPDTNSATVVLAGGSNPLQPGLITSAITTISSVIAGNGTSLTVAGPGTLTLPGANTYGGSTILSGGNVSIGNNAAFGTGTLNLASGSLTASAAVTLANPFTLNDSTVTIGGVNNITFTGAGALSDSAGGTNTLTVSNGGLTTISGILADGMTKGSLTVAGTAQISNPFFGVSAGTGNLVLGGSAANTYSGGTVLANGSLVVAAAGALGTGPLTLSSGTLMSGTNTTTLANPVVVNGSVALAASSAGGTSSTASGFTFTGPVSLPGNSSLAINDTVVFSGIVSGPGQLTVTGLGSLTLGNSANTFTGGVVLNAGSLGATGTLIVAGSNGITGGVLTSGSLGIGPLTLVNGTLQASTNATIANQLNLGGGYVTFAGTNLLTFSQAALTAPPTNTIVGTANLIANAVNTTSPANTTTIADILTGSGSLTLFGGTGTLQLTGADSFFGATMVNGGTLSLSGANGSLTSTSTITLNEGGVLTLDDTGVYLTNRLAGNSIQLDGGTLNFVGGSAAASETIGSLILEGGNSTVRVAAATSSTATLAVGSLQRSVPGATVGFLAGAGQKFGGADQITFSFSPPLAGNIIPYATITDATTAVTVGGNPFTNSGGYNLATANGSNSLVALTAYQSLSTSGSNAPTDNVLVSATPTQAIASDTVNALLMIGDGINLSGASGATLTVSSGQVAGNDNAATPTGNVISVSNLAFGSAEGLVFNNAGSMTISSIINGTGGLTIAGTGNVTLPTPNNYSGGSGNVQTINLFSTPTPTSGSFSLSFNGATTGLLSYTSPAAVVQTALQGLLSIGAGNVLVTQNGGIGPYTVTFTGLLGLGVQPQITVGSSTLSNGLTGASAATVVINTTNAGFSATTFNGGTTVNSTGSTFSVGGTLTLGTNNAILGGLTFSGGTLQASSAVTLPNSVVFGTNSGGSSVATFGGNNSIILTGGAVLNGLTAAISVATAAAAPVLIPGIVSSMPGQNGTASSTTALIKEGPGTLSLVGNNTYTGVTWVQQGILNAQNSTALGASGNAVQVITFAGTITGGTFTLAYNNATTGPITWSSSGVMLANNIQFALNALPTIGLSNAAVTGTGPFTVTFQNQLGATPLLGTGGGLTASGASLAGAGATVTTAVTTPGSASETVVASGATLQLQSGSVAITLAESFTISGSGVGGVGAVQNLVGSNTLTSGITLAAGATIGGNVGSLTVSGIITGASDLTKVGSGTLQLGGDNNYTGFTNLTAGVVQLNDSTGLGSDAGGTAVASGTSLQLGIGAGTGVTTGAITSRVGTVAGEALTISGAGLGLVNSTLLTANGALMANSNTPVTWTGNITLSADTTIDTAVTTADSTVGNVPAVMTLSGNISGLGGLIKVGSSTLYLTAPDTYTGATTVQVGTLTFAGAGSWQPATAPGINAVQTLTFGGTVTGGTFTLGFNGANTSAIAYSSVASVLQLAIQNALAALPTVGLAGNSNTLVNAVSVGSTASFTVTFQNQLGMTTVPALTVSSSLTGTNPTLAVVASTPGVAAVNVRVGAAFTLDNSAVNLPDRLADTATISLGGGTLGYVGNGVAGVASTETVGAITLGSGANTVSITSGSGFGASAILTSAALFRAAGATVTFVGVTTALGSATSQLQFASPIAAQANSPYASLINGILPFATVQAPGSTSLNFATFGTPNGLAAFANYVTNLATAQPTDNVIVTTATTLAANVKVNSLLLLGTLTLTAGAGGSNYTLTVGSGGIVASSGGTATVTGGTLDFGTSEGVITAATNITDNSATTGSNGLTVSGAGTVTLNGTGVYTGITTYNGGGINSGNFAVGTVAALGNTSLTATAGIIGTSFGGNFSVFSNSITLNNSVVNFGLSSAQPTFAGPITLIGSDFISANNTANIAGAIGGTGSLTIGPSATNAAIVLEGNNTYTGGTNLNPAGAGGSNSTELDVCSSTAFGTGPINWFGGQINTMRVIVGPAVESATGAVTIPNAITLVNAAVVFAGPWFKAQGLGYINLTGPITVIGSSTISATVSQNLTISGVISGSGSLTIGTQMWYGPSPELPYVPTTVTLTNANTISGGIAFTPALNPVISGGTGGQLILENSSALGTGVFTFGSGILQDDGVHPLTISNPVQFDAGGALRTINATNPAIPITFTGVVTSTAAFANAGGNLPGIELGGPGSVVFNSPIAINNAFVVNQGTTVLTGSASLTATSLMVNPGATLVIDNTTTNNANRLADGMPITLAGGTIAFKGNAKAGVTTSETLGAITLNAGNSIVSSTSAAGAASILTISSLTRNTGAILNFVGLGTNLGTATNQINVAGSITPNPTAVTGGFILPFATVTGTAGSLDFASVSGTNGPFSITAFTGYVNEPLASATNGMDVVKITGNDPVGGTSTPAAVLISGDNITIGSGGGSLNLAAGALLVTGATNAGDTLAVPIAIASPSGEGLLISNSNPTSGNAALNLTGTISDNSTGALTIGGSGNLELSAANTYSGTTNLTGGILTVNNNAVFGAPSDILAITNGTLEAGSSGGSAGIVLTNPIQLNTGLGGLGAMTFAGVNPLTLSGVISGNGGVTVNGGSAPLTFAGSTANTFIGGLTVNSGTLLLSKTAFALGDYGNVVIDGGTIQVTTNVNQFTGTSGSTHSANITLSATNAVQTLTFSTSPAPTGGTFTLTFNGATTAPIAYNSVAATLQSNIQNALNALSTVGAGNSVVVLPSGNTVMIVFQGALGGTPQNTMTAAFGSLLPAASNVTVATTTAGMHGTLALGPNPAEIDSLTFLNGGTVTMTTGTMSFNSFNGNIQTIDTPLFPGQPVSPSNPMSPSTALISGGTVGIVGFTNNATFPIIIQNSGGTFSTPSQSLSFSGITGGNFTLSFNGATTAAIPYSTTASALASSIQSALNALSAVTAIGTTSAIGSGSTVTVTFLNTAPASVIPPITANIAPPASSVQQLSFPAATGGTFTLAFAIGTASANTSAPINYSTNPATLQSNIQAALNTLVGNNLTTVTAINATTVNVTFQGADGSGVITAAMSGSGAPINQKQTISFTGVTGGTFALAFNNGTTSATTTSIAYSSATTTLASNIQNALNNLATIGSGNASVSVSGTTATITFQGTLAGAVESNIAVNEVPAGSTVQNIAFTGAPTGGIFTLAFTTPAGTVNTSSAITYSTNPTTLASNIQTALNTIVGSGLATASGVSATSVNVTFQGADAAGVIQPANALTANGLIANAVQTLAFPTTATGGTFTLAFGTATTSAIVYSTSLTALASNIQSALNSLSTITSPVTVLPVSGTTVSVTFGGGMGGQVQPLISGNGVTANAAYTINFTGSPTGGTFKLTFNSAQTANINYSTNPGTLQANIQNALDALGTIGAGNTLVVVNAAATSATVTFQNALAGRPEPPITAAGTFSTGGGVSVTPTTADGFLGLQGAATQTITAATTTVGFGGLTGTGAGTINIATTQSGFGIVGGTNFNATPTANTGLPGLTGGSSTTITGAILQPGFGLAGSSPSVNIATANPGYAGDMVIASGITGTVGITKLGAGSLTFAGTTGNTFTGATNIDEGSVLLDKQAAVAAISAPLVVGIFSGNELAKVVSNFPQLNGQNIIVTSSSTLDLTPAATTANFGTTANQTIGALDIRGGTVQTGTNTLILGGDVTAVAIGTSSATLSGKVDLGGNNRNFSVLDAATATGVTNGLNVTATISSSSGAFGITKLGAGTLTFQGTAANTYSGTTNVNEGTLVLAQTTGVAVPGTLVVGDGVGGSGSTKVDVVRLGASNQIASTAAVTVNNSGLLDLNSANNTLASLAISGGTVSSGTGTLTLNGNIAGIANVANLTPATINGNLALGSTQRTFDIQQGSLVNSQENAVPDMVVNAVISGTAGLAKVSDNGALELNAVNTLSGASTVSAGPLLLDGSLGGGTLTVSGSGVLGGTGTSIPVFAATGGTINPGDPASSKGILTASNVIGTPASITAADLTGGGNLTIQISGFTTPGVSYDQFKVAGLGILKLSSTSTLTLDLAGLNGAASDGTALGVIQFSGLEGSFAPGNILTVNNPQGLVPLVKYNANSIDVSFAGQATHFGFIVPSNVTAGTSFTMTVSALDQFNDIAPSYNGTVHFASSDHNANVVLPADAVLTGGSATFTAKLITATVAGNTPSLQTISATDTSSSSITASTQVTVNPNTIFGFAVSAPSSAQAGQLIGFQVTAQDQFGNTIPNYAGTVHFSSSDSQAVFSFDTTLTNGIGSFAGFLKTVPLPPLAPTQTISATQVGNSSITGISNSITMSAGALNHFNVNAPSSISPGAPFNVTVTAQDAYNNAVANYTGIVHFASSDLAATLPHDSTLVSGSGTFSVTLKTAGTQNLSVNDTVATTITGTAAVTVNTAAATSFVITAPTSATAGHGFVFTVTAKDASNNTVTGYSGTVQITSTDGQSDLPSSATLTGGVGFFSATLRTAGPQTLIATDSLNAGITGKSAAITVSGLAVSHFAVIAPSSATTGMAFNFTVKAQDQFGNSVPGYNGTVHFTSTDPGAALPGNATLAAGTATFSATLKSPGPQTISATDAASASITGTSANIATLGLTVTSVTPTPTGFVAVFSKPFDPTQINLYDSSGTYGPDDVLLTGPGAPQTSFHGSLIIDPTNQTITFIKTSTFTNSVNSFNPQTGVLTAGTYTVTFRSATNGFVDLLGAPLDGTSSGNPAGSNYTTTFVVASTPAEVVGIPGFARGPNSAQAINLPNNLGFGIPLNLSTGSGVTSGKFTLQYNSALLSITGVTVNSVLTGATLTYDAASTPGSAVIDFSSPTALAAGPVRLGGLVATVPNSAAPSYTSKALLHWSSVNINGSATGVTADDAVEVVAYFGDTNGDGTLSGGDASLISRVATGVDNNPATGIIGGFSAFRLADPVLIGDLTAAGNVGAGDVTLMNSYLSGTPRPQIPTLPTGLTIPSSGPDPSLSLPADLQVTPGSMVVVPVSIDTARPEGSTGMTEAILALHFDPTVFTVSASDIALGTLPMSSSGWQLQTAINSQTGEIGIDLFSSNAIRTTASGSLAIITLQVRETAPAGQAELSLVSTVNPTGHLVYQTTVSDAQGSFVLHYSADSQATLASGGQVKSSAAAQMGSDAAPLATGLSSMEIVERGPIDLPAVALEQVFGNLEDLVGREVLSTSHWLGQPEALLSSAGEQVGMDDADQELQQQIWSAQLDWAAVGQAAYQTSNAKVSRITTSLSDLLDGLISDQPANETTGLEKFFARQGGQSS